MSFLPYRRLSAEPLHSGPQMQTPIVFERTDPPRWAYHVVTIDPREEPPLDEARLAELGDDGWLLAAVVQFPTGAAPTRLLYHFVRSA